MDSPPLAPGSLLFPFYGNDSLTHSRPHNLVGAQSNDSLQSSPVQPSPAQLIQPPPARPAHICLSLLTPLPDFTLIDDDDAKGRQ